MSAFPLMLWVKLLVIDRIHPQSNVFARGEEIQPTGNLKLNDIPAVSVHLRVTVFFLFSLIFPMSVPDVGTFDCIV